MTTDPTVARRGDVTEQLHGVVVDDPYRWMEDLDDPALQTWVDAVADEAAAALAALPGRAELRRTLARVVDRPRGGAPWRRGSWWFQRRNTGLQDHDVLWCAPATSVDGHGPDPSAAPPDAGWRALVDPNTWEGAGSLGPVAASPDGSLLAWARSEAGSDWQTWSFREVATGTDLSDRVTWSKFSGASWLPDGSGIVTCTYAAPAAGEEHEAAQRDQRVVRHRLGRATGVPDGETEVVHARPDEPEFGFTPIVSHDGRWLVLVVSRGTDPETRVHVAPLDEDGGIGDVRRLLDDGEAAWWPLGTVATPTGEELWLRTDDSAPLGRLVAVDLADGSRREVLASGGDQLEEARLVGGAGPAEPMWLVTSRLHHAASVVEVRAVSADRRSLGPARVVVDGAISAGGTAGGELAGGRADRRLHIVTTSFTHPSQVLTHDLGARTTAPWGPTAAGGDHDGQADVVVDRVFVRSGDVRVPVFLVHRSEVEPSGAVPTVLWGYGGFSIAVTPHFRPGWSAWVAHGGLLAVACLRGGSEYGRPWADAGRRAHKQHVFDDALAVTRWLQGDGEAWHDADGTEPVTGPAWTAPAHTGIEGRSNGGLLAAACLTQAPELFGSAVPEVGVLDLLRFHRFTIGWAWTSDYGDPDTPEGLSWVLGYSPLHRVEQGVDYPPTLVTTGDTDDRVVPSHSFKFAATLRHVGAPVLLRVDRSAGHGAGKPISQILDERADVLAFHAASLGLGID